MTLAAVPDIHAFGDGGLPFPAPSQTYSHEGSSGQYQDRLRQVAAGIAHDYNNLLTAVMVGADLAMNCLSPQHAARDALEMVSTAAEQAAFLTRQLAAYAGVALFVPSVFDLSAIVRKVVASLRRTIKLRLDLADGVVVRADSSQIEQLLAALIANAVEAIGSGTAGAISVRTCAAQSDIQPTNECISLAQPCEGGYAELEVSDTGCGMDDCIRSRIFDPFFSTKFLGRGLGLAAVAGTARAHRGVIEVKSAPGSGSSFRVYLPMSKIVVGSGKDECIEWQRS